MIKTDPNGGGGVSWSYVSRLLHICQASEIPDITAGTGRHFY